MPYGWWNMCVIEKQNNLLLSSFPHLDNLLTVTHFVLQIYLLRFTHGLTNREIGEAKKVTKFEVNPANLSGFWREI